MVDNHLLYKNLDVLKKSSNNIILFGEVGSGKTTIINKLCNKKFETKESGYSCTKNIQYAYIPDGSIIIDFPGLNAAEDIIKHLTIQKFILSIIPVKMICLVIKSDTRFDNILKITFQMIKIFYENRANLILILTFTERYTDKEKNEIKFQLNKRLNINENVVIFNNKNIEPSVLLQQICNLKNNLFNINSLNINEKKLLNSDLDEAMLELKELKLKEFKYFISILKQKLDIYQYSNEIKYALFLTFKYYINNLIEVFKEELEKKIQDIDTINAEIIIFSNELYVYLNAIISKNESYSQILKTDNYGKMSCESLKDGNKLRINFIYGNFNNSQIIIIIDFEILDINIFLNQNKNISITSNFKFRNIDNNDINIDNYMKPIGKNIPKNQIQSQKRNKKTDSFKSVGKIKYCYNINDELSNKINLINAFGNCKNNKI